MLCACTVLALVGVLPAQEPALEPLSGTLPWVDDGLPPGCRVVDARTGRPLPGAELHVVAESTTPVPGEFWQSLVVTADADGFVSLPDGLDRSAWLVLTAPGYGPASELGTLPGPVWALAPGLDVPVRVLDWLERPVPGARVGFCVGCGHTPDVVNAVADAQGIALLAGIDPWNGIADVYPEHPDLGVHEYGRVRWTPGDPPDRLQAPYGEPLRGIVLDATGQAVAGAFVGTKTVHRGPWTRTRADGSFLLEGCRPGEELFVVLPSRPGHEVLFDDPRLPDAATRRRPRTLRLPPPDEERTQVVLLPAPRGRSGLLRLLLRDPGDAALARVRLQVLGPRPAVTVTRATTGDDGAVELELVAGTYEVRCDDRRFLEPVGELAVEADGTVEASLQTRLRPTLPVEIPPGARVRCVRGTASHDLSDLVRRGQPVPLPFGEDFGLWISDEEGRDGRLFAFAADDEMPRGPLRLDFWPPTHVSARLVDEGGDPVEATVALLEGGDLPDDLLAFEGTPAPEGRLTLAGRRAGAHVLAIRPRREDLRPRLLALSLPDRGPDAALDLGTVRLEATPRLRVVYATAPFEGTASLARLGWSDLRELPEAPVGADGVWLGLEPRAGDVLVVPAAGWTLETFPTSEGPAVLVPCRTELEGDGPWTVELPTGRIDLEIRDPAGAPLDATVFVADRAVAVQGGVQLRQLPLAPCTLWITAEGRRSVRVDVDLRVDALARVVVPLAAR